MKEFEFDPAKIVLGICHIYTQLGASNDFCAAVSRDGRSYSPQLFARAEVVLGNNKFSVKTFQTLNCFS
jgi:ubiquitin conjugation factor E4 A